MTQTQKEETHSSPYQRQPDLSLSRIDKKTFNVLQGDLKQILGSDIYALKLGMEEESGDEKATIAQSIQVQESYLNLIKTLTGVNSASSKVKSAVNQLTVASIRDSFAQMVSLAETHPEYTSEIAEQLIKLYFEIFEAIEVEYEKLYGQRFTNETETFMIDWHREQAEGQIKNEVYYAITGLFGRDVRSLSGWLQDWREGDVKDFESMSEFRDRTKEIWTEIQTNLQGSHSELTEKLRSIEEEDLATQLEALVGVVNTEFSQESAEKLAEEFAKFLEAVNAKFY